MTTSIVDPGQVQRSMQRTARRQTIEDRLESKAAVADMTDFSGQRSLGQMLREERRKALFGE